jgi:hypothetical protein
MSELNFPSIDDYNKIQKKIKYLESFFDHQINTIDKKYENYNDFQLAEMLSSLKEIYQKRP